MARQNAKWEREIALEHARWLAAGRWGEEADEPRGRGKCSPAGPPVSEASEDEEGDGEEGRGHGGVSLVSRGGNAYWLGRRMMMR